MSCQVVAVIYNIKISTDMIISENKIAGSTTLMKSPAETYAYANKASSFQH